MRPAWDKLISAMVMVTLGIGVGVPVALMTYGNQPAHPHESTPAYCTLEEDTITSDHTLIWPKGMHAPCKWFKSETNT